jgi:hypothetical protein
MIKVVDDMSDEEIVRGLQINNQYADFVYNMNIRFFEAKIVSMNKIKKCKTVSLKF